MKSSELGDVFGRNDFDNVEPNWKSVYCIREKTIDSQWSDYAMIVVVNDKNGFESIQNDEINNCFALILIYCRIYMCASQCNKIDCSLHSISNSTHAI